MTAMDFKRNLFCALNMLFYIFFYLAKRIYLFLICFKKRVYVYQSVRAGKTLTFNAYGVM